MYKIIFLGLLFAANASVIQDKEVTFDNDSFIVKYHIEDKNIVFTLKAKTKGWLAIGISPENRMKGANFIIGYVKAGDIYIEDHYGVSTMSHKADSDLGGKDNINILGGGEASGYTEISFSIPLDSGDEYDKKLETGKTYNIIVGYGRNDNIRTKHNYIKRGKITL